MTVTPTAASADVTTAKTGIDVLREISRSEMSVATVLLNVCAVQRLRDAPVLGASG